MIKTFARLLRSLANTLDEHDERRERSAQSFGRIEQLPAAFGL